PGLPPPVDALASDDTGRLDLDLAPLFRFPRALAVHRHAQRVEHAPHHSHTHRHVGDAAGALDHVAFAKVLLHAHQCDADRVFLEVQHQAREIMGKFDQLAGHHPFQTVDARNAVAGGKHRAGLADLDLLAIALDLLAKDAADLVG